MTARRIAQHDVFRDHGATLNFDDAAAPLVRAATADNKDIPGEQIARLYYKSPIRPVVLTNIDGCTHGQRRPVQDQGDRKSTRLNSSHLVISYAVFCLT